MAAATFADPVLTRFRSDVDLVYGSRVERVVLFGSRARDDWQHDSDYDIAVFVRDPGQRWAEIGTLAKITTQILFDTGEVVSAKPFAAGAYDLPTPLMHEIRRDGIDL